MKKKKKEKPLTGAKARVRIQKKQTNPALMDLKRQLRIEASLDRVRKKALSMKKPDDLLNICKALYTELQLLGFDALRNSMINIHNDDNESFLNYDYAKAGPSITHFTYHTHPVIENLVRQMKSGRAAFSEQVLSGKKLTEFKAFRKSHGEKTDAKLRDAKALYYYFYSIGTGALGISNLAPLDPDQLKILKRFRNVFDLAYRRYADIQKAEAQARESQIEAALEKVRSRSLAMHTSDELREVVKAVFDKLQELNFVLEDGAVSILIFKENSRDHTQWIADPGHSYATPFELPYSDHSISKDLFIAKESGVDYLSKIYPTEEKNEYFNYLFAHSNYKYLPDEVKALILGSSQYGFSIAFTKHAAIVIPTNSGRLLTQVEKEILKRFARVFEQAYTRFLDIQKAEAQAREAQIEAALEKVRSRSLAMHHSDELEQVVASLFDRLVELGLSFDGALIFIFEKEKRNIQLWIATNHLSAPVKIDLPYDQGIKDNAIIKDLWNTIEKGEHIFNRSYSGETKNDYFRYVSKYNESKIPESVRKIQIEADGWTAYFAAEKNSIVGFDSWSGHNITTEDFQTLIRFARVFEQAYTRFLDLQKAEAQARESQIQLALERVRSRTMAMQHSNELAETSLLLTKQVRALGIQAWGCAFNIFDEDQKSSTEWFSNEEGYLPTYKTPREGIFLRYYEAAQRGESLHIEEIAGEACKAHYRYLSTLPVLGDILRKYIESGIGLPTFQIDHVTYFKHGYLLFVTLEPVPEAYDIFKRFAAVFEQTYTRFLDLQKAEAQAREAQIEAALEKVRSRSMGMQKSTELREIVALIFNQMRKLGFDLKICNILLVDATTLEVDYWVSFGEEEILPESYHIPYFDHPTYHYQLNAWRDQSPFAEFELSGQIKASWEEYLMTQTSIKTISESIKDMMRKLEKIFISSVAIKNGLVQTVSVNHLSADSITILQRFAKVFEQSYTRFLDLQKAEAQAREAQIEAALERVRARTMAMQKSDELADVAGLMFQQVTGLGISAWTTGFNVWSDDNNSYTDYVTSPLGRFVEPYTIDTRFFSSFKEISDAKKRGEEFFVQYLEGDLLKETYLELSKFGDKEQYVKMREGGFEFPIRQFDHFVFLSNISLMFITYDPVPEAHDIFKRFGKVFEQTYTRFLDLQKSEAQSRESQIQLALERVRSSTMAMHRSEELQEVISVTFEQIKSLEILIDSCIITLFIEGSDDLNNWVASAEQKYSHPVRIPYFKHPLFDKIVLARAKPGGSFTIKLSKEENQIYYTHILENSDFGKIINADRRKIVMNAESNTMSFANFRYTGLRVGNFRNHDYTPEENDIILRVAKVFDQAYIRFLDLQKAEEQAREAQIEAALERIRSRALAMHASGDLIDVANVLRDQMGLLGQPELESSIVHLYHDNSNTFETWYAFRPPDRSSGKIITGAATVYTDSSEWSREVIEKYASPDNEYTIVSSGQKINEWYKVVEVIAPAVVEYDHDGQLIVPEILYYHFSKFLGGALLMISNQQPSVEARELQKRAAVVFGLAVTRFLDLQKAEAQAREAKIEASLERVRGKAMAMHSPADLAATIGIFYRELESFSITPRRCGVGLLDKETRVAELSTMNTTDKGGSIEIVGKLKMQGHPVLEGVFDNWILQREYHPVLRGNEIKEYYQLLRPQISFPEYPNDAVQFGYFFFFPEGGVYAWTEKELAEDELKIYRRFTSVLSLTYKRYKDLKDAETRAKDAVKQATLDRVRAEIASMRTKQDLDRITPLIWNELTILGIPFVRCGVFIMDDKHQLVHTFLSTPDGKAIGAFHLDYETKNLKEAIRHWHDNQVYVTHWGEKEFGEMASTLLKQGSITSLDQYLKPTEGIHLHFLPFLQGMLYVGNTTRLQQDDIRLVQSLAEAFSTAYARYEDFNNLEAAKQQVEKTLVDLKQTQQQLVQSEKMASLGELTAGIAHEIQNPLNFVNNFSEVSNELIEEMVEEVKKGNFDEAKIIANDLKQNLEKINHHGKRADGIVKSMLQHSRSSSGQKELTDINVLCDEYLRLSYHGLRAKDKTFNAKFETDFDSTLEKIDVIPQDIGRVILNLINNAFYAVTEKRNANPDGYDPTIFVSTKQRDDKVEITVKDNGNGIPEQIKDKIFQPFFTTKPTGQGTGLGLSLSYDIVKAHGGTLEVISKEGEGSEFIIQLPN